MKEEIVSFEVAKLAKEKGFNIPCRSKYTVMKTKKKFTTNSMLSRISTKDNVYLVPTQSLLQKWLREKHNIIVFINPYPTTYAAVIVYNNREDRYATDLYDTYEIALEKGLEEALKLIELL